MKVPFTSYEIPLHLPGFIRRHKWRWIIGAAIFLVFVLPVILLSQPKQTQYVTAVAKIADLEQTVEAVGTVTSEKDLELEFKSPGIVADVAVKQGDVVKAGQRLASLRAAGLAASIQSSQASVQEAEANLQALLEGTRPEDIAIAEASLQNKKAALAAAKESALSAQTELDILKNEIEVTQSSDVSLAPSTMNENITTAQQAISAVQDVLRNNDLQDAIARGNPGNYYSVQSQLNALPSEFTGVLSSMSTIVDVPSAISAYKGLRAALVKTSTVLGQVFSVVSATQETSYLTPESLTTYKTAINTQRSNVQASVTAIDTAINNLQQTPASLATKLANSQSALNKAKADVLTYETSVRIEEAQLQLKKAGSRPTDISASKARLNLARANLARAMADLADTQIIAPVDGVVTRVAVKAGESSPIGTAISLQGDSPYRIEMFVSEVDVPKVHEGQTGSIVLDAFRSETLPLRLAEIDESATDKDGVPKYRLKLDFAVLHDGLRVGMTGDASIVTGSRMQVLTIPRRAVMEDEDGRPAVRVRDGSIIIQKNVETGMEGDSDIEIMSGLKEGETVIVLEKQ